MSFNPAIQRRAAFIRGKTKSELDTVLLQVASAAKEASENDISTFNEVLNDSLRGIIYKNAETSEDQFQKTIDNYRTEIIRSLFGLVVFSEDFVTFSDRGKRLLDSNDQSAFFKELVYMFQFPFPGCSAGKWQEQQGMSLRPGPYIVQLLAMAKTENIYILKEEIFFYVLNSSQVQDGKITVEETYKRILHERKNGRSRGFPVPPEPNSSKARQHLNEFMGYMELSMLVLKNQVADGDVYVLNPNEESSIDEYVKIDACKVKFHGTEYLSHKDRRDAWDAYWTSIPESVAQSFLTFTDSSDDVGLALPVEVTPDLEIGRKGELYVLQLEHKRVGNYDSKLVKKIKDRAHERNIGFDIQSVRATFADEDHDYDEMIYIEVKSTKRATKIVEVDDSVRMTRNEWIKAKEGLTSYYIYRVYFTSEGVQLFVINNPYGLDSAGSGIRAVPTEYAVSIKNPKGEWIEIE